jgi:hypothetical protein
VEAAWGWAAQCHRVDTGLAAQPSHSAGDGRTGWVGGTAPGYDSQVVSERWHGGDLPLTHELASRQSI